MRSSSLTVAPCAYLLKSIRVYLITANKHAKLRGKAIIENVYACLDWRHTMPKLTAQYQYRFTPDHNPNLLALAAATNSIAKTGPNARQPSVAVMFEGIADGKLIFVEREPWSLPAGLAEQAAAVEEQEREQARIAEQQQREQERIAEQLWRVEAHTAQK